MTRRAAWAILLLGLPISAAASQFAVRQPSIPSPAVARKIAFARFADDGVPPLALARDLLPPAIAARIVGADKTWLTWSSTSGYALTFWAAAAPVDGDACSRDAYAIDVYGPGRSAFGMMNDVMARPGVIRPFRQMAIVEREGEATAASCARTRYFLVLDRSDPAQELAAWRGLYRAMRLARGADPLPFALRCRAAGDDPSCADARASLTTLPLHKLRRIRRPQDRSPPAIGEPQAMFDFLPTGPRLESWHVRVVGSAPAAIELERVAAVYH